MQDIINWYSNLESMAKGDLNMILEIWEVSVVVFQRPELRFSCTFYFFWILVCLFFWQI
jgi:hypothetical protein